MKKILSTIVAALVAVSFAAIVSASNVPTSEPSTATPAVEMRKESKPMKKHLKHRKLHRHRKHDKTAMKDTAPAYLEAGMAVAAPPDGR